MTPIIEHKTSGTKEWNQLYADENEDIGFFARLFGKDVHQKGEYQEPHIHLSDREVDEYENSA